MGTYTANKNLYMPTVGEQGWGTLMNTNLSTIDTFLKPITVSGSTYTFTGSHVGNQSGGSISATSITNSGTLTNTGTSTFTGKITANGGIGTTSLTTSSTITSTGKITSSNIIQCQKVYVDGRLLTTKMSNYSPTYATCTAQSTSAEFGTSQNLSSTSTLTVNGYSNASISYPVRVGCGVYIPAASNIKSGSVPSSVSRTATLSVSYAASDSVTVDLYVNNTKVASVTAHANNRKPSTTYTVKNGDKVYAKQSTVTTSTYSSTMTVSIAAASTYYLDGI